MKYNNHQRLFINYEAVVSPSVDASSSIFGGSSYSVFSELWEN